MKRLMSLLTAPFLRMAEWLRDHLQESRLYQAVRARYDEMDPVRRDLLNKGVLGGLVALVVFGIIGGMIRVHNMKTEYQNILTTIQSLQSVSTEVKTMKSRLAKLQGSAAAAAQNPGSILTNMVATSLIAQTNAQVGNEVIGSATDSLKENTIDVTLTQVSLRQVIRYCNQVDNSRQGMRVKHLVIDTHQDPEGYMDATIKVAIYRLQ